MTDVLSPHAMAPSEGAAMRALYNHPTGSSARLHTTRSPSVPVLLPYYPHAHTPYSYCCIQVRDFIVSNLTSSSIVDDMYVRSSQPAQQVPRSHDSGICTYVVSWLVCIGISIGMNGTGGRLSMYVPRATSLPTTSTSIFTQHGPVDRPMDRGNPPRWPTPVD